MKHSLALRRLIDPKRSQKPGNAINVALGVESDPEAVFLNRWRQLGGPEPERQFRFSLRKWRFDFAWPQCKTAVEIDGGTWAKGRHVRGGGFARDCEKMNHAILAGWTVLRLTPAMIRNWVPVIEEYVRERTGQ